jgi:hypothetical protein
LPEIERAFEEARQDILNAYHEQGMKTKTIELPITKV